MGLDHFSMGNLVQPGTAFACPSASERANALDDGWDAAPSTELAVDCGSRQYYVYLAHTNLDEQLLTSV